MSASRVLQKSDLSCYHLLFCVRKRMRIQVVCVRNFHVLFFILIWRAAPFVFLCRSMPSASLMTLNLSRSIGTRARRHAHTAINTCNTTQQHSNTPGKQQHNFNTTALLHACPCTHLCVHTPTQTYTLAHTREKKKAAEKTQG